MFKPYLLLGLLTAGTTLTPSHAQSIADLVEQLTLDKEKLSSLKATLQDMVKGYESLKRGYVQIRDLAEYNFMLHKSYLDGLSQVSPNVQSDPRINTIFDTERQFLQQYKAGIGTLGNGSLFTPPELLYINNIYSTLLQRSTQSIEELNMVVTDNQLQMTDAQRLQAIDRIDIDAKSQLAAVQQLNGIVAVQIAQRQGATRDINTLKTLYGLPD